MGLSYHTYIGPYIEVFNPLKPSTKKYHSCPNEKCSNNKKGISDAFCGKCGTRVQLLNFPCKERITFYYLDEFSEKTSLQTPSGEFDRDKLYFIDDALGDSRCGNDNCICDLTHTNVQAGLDTFKEVNHMEITRLKEVFGADNVVIKWGVMTYLA